MILVDTSVWIDYLRDNPTPAVQAFETLIAQEQPFGLTGIIYQEVLQGADSWRSLKRLRAYLDTQRFVSPKHARASYAEAAGIYFRCRRAGATIRSTIDCLIAGLAIEHGLWLLQDDRDYATIAAVVPELKLYPV